MAFELDKLRIERVNVELSYDATYTFFGLRGVIAERWAHGPIFGALGEAGSTQINLTPPTDEGVDQRLVGVAGIRTSGLLAEGQHWTAQFREIAEEWFAEILTVLKPQRMAGTRCDILALYPISDQHAATRRLVERYYREDELRAFAGEDGDRFLAAVEFFAPEETPKRTIVMGAVGPPHKGLYFSFPDLDRDSKWWMGVRVVHLVSEEDDMTQPLETLRNVIDRGYSEVNRVVRSALPGIVGQ